MKPTLSPDVLVFAAIIGILLSPWLQPAWSLWTPLLIACCLFGIWVACSQLASSWTRSRMGVFSGTISAILGALLCGISWSLFNAQMALAWKLPEALWRSAETITVAIDRPVRAQTHSALAQLRIEGRVLHSQTAWELPLTLVGRRNLEPRIRLSWFATEFTDLPEEGEVWQLVARVRPATQLANEGMRPGQIRLLRDGIRVTGSVIASESNQRLHGRSQLPLRSRIGNWVDQRAANAEHPTGLYYTGIMKALMNGDRDDMRSDQWRVLQHTGVAHVMAISGLHLTLVFASAWWLFRTLVWLPGGVWRIAVPMRWQGEHGGRQGAHETMALLLALIVAVFYASLAGFAVSTLRALLLISGFVLARLLAYRTIPIRILLRCVLCVLIMDPLAWLDAGFWLSVFAVGAIFVWQWREPIHSQVNLSLRGKIFTLWRLEWMLTVLMIPLSVLYFQGIPWIAPVANLLVLPIFTLVILPACLLAIAFLGSPWLLIADGLLRVSDIALHMVFYCLAWLEQIPFGWWSTQDARWFAVPLLWIVVRYWPLAWWPRLGLAGLVGAISFWVLTPAPAAEFAVHMLDVGQGNALVIQRGRRALIYDTGPAFAGERVILPFLRYHRLTPDWMVLSHPHADHTGGAAAIRGAFPGLQTLETRIQATELMPGVDGRWPCEWGQVWRWQGVLIHALAPMPGPSFGVNNDSCVLLLRYQGEGVLLTGDIQRTTELRMVGRYPDAFSAAILQVPHHGSQTSSHPDFLDRVRPEFALVGTGFLNQWAMPHTDVEARYYARGIPLLNTAESGQISLYLQSPDQSESRWRLRRFREDIRPVWYLQQVAKE